MAEEVWKGDHSGVFEPSYQLSLNKFFDPSTPSMRKERNRREKNRKKKERMMKIVATDVVPVEPTGTPTACANIRIGTVINIQNKDLKVDKIKDWR